MLTLKNLKRVIILVIGLTIIFIGFAFFFLPGPGILIIVIGLILLGTEFIWARKILKKFKNHAKNIKKKFF